MKGEESLRLSRFWFKGEKYRTRIKRRRARESKYGDFKFRPNELMATNFNFLLSMSE